MYRLIVKCVSALALAIPFSVGALADDIELANLRQTIENKVMLAVQSGDFDTLEKMAETYRASKTVIADGTTELEVFYDSTGWYFDLASEDEDIKRWYDGITKWQAAYPKSPTAVMMHALTLYNHAWQIRGNSYADKVWKNDWANFQSKILEAKKVLEDSKATTSGDARWYSLMIAINGSMGEKKAVLLALAREGLNSRPTSLRIHTVLMNYLLPKWGGSRKLMHEWVDEAVALTRSTEGDIFYARLYWTVLGEFEKDEFNKMIDWPRMKKAFDDLLERYPNIKNMEGSLRIACASRDPDEVQKRWALIARTAGPRLEPTVEPAKYCRWPKPIVFEQPHGPDMVDPNQILNDRGVRDIHANPSTEAPIVQR
jgi:hypothetical protein